LNGVKCLRSTGAQRNTPGGLNQGRLHQVGAIVYPLDLNVPHAERVSFGLVKHIQNGEKCGKFTDVQLVIRA